MSSQNGFFLNNCWGRLPGDIADFFVKRHKSGPDQAQADPTPKTSSPGSSQPGASQASQCEHREGSSLPPPDINNDWPDLWSAKQTEDFKSKNPWLGSKNKKLGCLVCSSVNSIGIDKEQGQGVSLSREWMNFEIQVSGQGSRTTSLSILRNKVRKHALSKAHTQAVKVAEQQKEAAIENAVETMTESYMKETEAVFRTAYHLAKRTDPFLTMRASLSCRN
ncbi:E3 SUMO-protein ligase KIAA1586-like [Coregonus clupeaformis]|uniref:E3 SUMO-protein ligase KIAA1586-like n=1 Tax=Coregonus clupeaformis TaxID=59861 RepID=UPI001E1C8A9F|nr:E3 SUMO-protein ligase KIAA1586-like [Coregonus clupeaformis]